MFGCGSNLCHRRAGALVQFFFSKGILGSWNEGLPVPCGGRITFQNTTGIQDKRVHHYLPFQQHKTCTVLVLAFSSSGDYQAVSWHLMNKDMRFCMRNKICERHQNFETIISRPSGVGVGLLMNYCRSPWVHIFLLLKAYDSHRRKTLFEMSQHRDRWWKASFQSKTGHPPPYARMWSNWPEGVFPDGWSNLRAVVHPEDSMGIQSVVTIRGMTFFQKPSRALAISFEYFPPCCLDNCG